MLALISGRGALPAAISGSLDATPLVCALSGFSPDGLEPDLTFRLEHLGSLLVELKKRGVSQVCFCGAIERPPFDPTALDAATLPLVPVMMQAMGSGDDAALRAVMTLFEEKGFEIRAAHDVAPGLLAPEGLFTRAKLTEEMLGDLERADAVLEALGPLDVGQGCVVGAGQVWGIETIGGTDHMLRTLPEAVRQAKAVFVKAPKPGQDLRADMPTVGPDTADALIDAGLAGAVIEAGHVIMLDAEETRARMDAAGLVLWSRVKS